MNEDFLDIILFLVGLPKESNKQSNILDFLENSDLPLYVKCLEARHINQENTNNYFEFEYNYLGQLQRSYNSLIENFFNNIKFKFCPYAYLPKDNRYIINNLIVQVVGYIDVPQREITYGYRIAKNDDDPKPQIISKKSIMYKFENGTPFHKSTHIHGLDLDSAREMAIDDIRCELKRIIDKRALIHPPDTLEIFCEEVIADIGAVRS